ncbi:hypothetical protein P4O66_005444, partial [Electrophorus voltai]
MSTSPGGHDLYTLSPRTVTQPLFSECNPNSVNFDTLKTCFNTAGNSRTACKSVTTASSMDKKANAPVTLKGALAKGGREESKGIFPAVDPTPKPAGFRIAQAHILPQKRGSSSGPTGVGGDKQMNVKPPPSRKKPPVTRQNVVGVQGKEPFRASAHSTAGCAQPKKKPLPVMRVRPMKPGRPPRVDLGQYRSRGEVTCNQEASENVREILQNAAKAHGVSHTGKLGHLNNLVKVRRLLDASQTLFLHAACFLRSLCRSFTA